MDDPQDQDPTTAPIDESSPDSGRRMLGFALTSIGALAMGVGTVLTWITFGLGTADKPLAAPTVPGLDLLDGKIVLGAAIVCLIAVLATRTAVTRRARRLAAVLVLICGLVGVIVTTAFLVTADSSSRFDSVASDRLSQQLSDRLGLSTADVQKQLEDAMTALGSFRTIGPGVYLALAGSALVLAGGGVVLTWARRLPTDPEDEAGATAPPDPRTSP